MRIYIDTSVINGMYAEDTPWIKEATKSFFNSAKKKGYKLYISTIVSDEIKRTPELRKRENLLRVIKEHMCIELSKTKKSENLANKYIKHKIIPHKYLPDALHIAIASVDRIPILVSWNFKHIVKHKTRVEVNLINKRSNHPQIDICSPEEV